MALGRLARAAWLLAASLLATLSLPSGALAAGSRVAIVKPAARDATLDEASVRLGAELRAAGFEVVMLEARRGVQARQQVEQSALEPPPFATIAILRTAEGASADVWVADRLTDKTVVRRIEPRHVAAEAPARTLAIVAVELLRASLLEVERDPDAQLPEDVARWMRSESDAEPEPAVAPAPVPGAPLPPVAVAPPMVAPPMVAPSGVVPSPAPAAAIAPRFPDAAAEPPRAIHQTPAIGIAPGLLVGALVPVAFVPTLRASHPLPLSFFARLSIAATVIDATVEAPAGSAEVRQDLVLLEAGRSFGEAGDFLVPWLAVGAGAYHFGARGRAITPYQAVGEDAWAFAMEAGAGLGIRLLDRLAITIEADVLVAVPRVKVAIGPDVVGPHGAPLFFPTVGLLVGL
jgi:hypothetical protein